MLQEFRHAFAQFRTRRAFAASVVLIASCAMGANFAVFSLMDAVILSPLPFRDADRLVEVTARRGEDATDPFSIPDFRDLRDGTRTFEALAAAFQWSANITGGEAERLQGMRASASLFSILGVGAEAGRLLLPEDEHGGGRVVVLTHGLWTRRFARDRAVIGTTILLNGEAHTVVGILPRECITPIREADVIAPFLIDSDSRREARDSGFLRLIGRLRPGVTAQQATTDLDAIMRRLRVEHPDTNATHLGVAVREWHRALVAKAEPLLVLLQAAVALVLAAACANLANLFLGSALHRDREFAVRAALGASRGRLVRGVLAESCVLAVAGSAGGMAFGLAGRRALETLAPADLLHASGGAALDWRMVSFVAAATSAAALTFAAVPCWRIVRGSLGADIQGNVRSTQSATARTARQWLVGIEVCVAFALVVTTVVLSQSFARLQAIDPGFRADHLLTVRLSLPKGRYPDRAAVVRFTDNLRPRLLNLPGVADAAAVNVVPLNGYRATADVWPGDRAEPEPADRPEAHYRMVGPAYFRTFGIPVVDGRAVDERDVAGSEQVVLINRALAARFWHARSPVGEYLMLRDDRDETVRRARIVGLTGDVKHFGLDTETTPDVYVPIPQVPEATIAWLMNNMYWGIRTTVDPGTLRESLRREVHELDPDVPASLMRTMDELMALATAPRLLNLWLVRVFGAAALALAAAGIYSVTAFSVSARTREIGIRAALGATSGANIRLLMADAGKPLVAGLVTGAGIVLVATPALRSVLFGVSRPSTAALGVVAMLMLAIGFAAALLAACRLRAISPVIALKAD